MPEEVKKAEEGAPPETAKAPEAPAPVAKVGPPRPFTGTIVGAPGGPFNVRGTQGFGVAHGLVSIGGRTLEVTSWNDEVIKGVLPLEIKSGELVVQLAGGAVLKGSYKG